MPDIFNRNSEQFGGSFAVDDASITFPNVTGFGGQFAGEYGLLVQNLSMNYQQQVTRLYEVGSPFVYYVGGRTQGTASLQRVLGPRSLSEAYYRKFGDICQAASNTLDFSIGSNCSTGDGEDPIGVSFTCYFCVIDALGVSVAASDNMIQQNQRLMFSSLDYSNA